MKTRKAISAIISTIMLLSMFAVPSYAVGRFEDVADTAYVVLSSQNLIVDGKNVDCEKYNIDGSNYFKLRDLAQLLNGTDSQFGVGYDAETATVTITTGQSYESTGSELVTGVDNSATAKTTNQTILINGTQHSELTVYNIGGSNFFQLRELGNVLGFGVDFDQDTNTAIVRGNKTAESGGQEHQEQQTQQSQSTTSSNGFATEEMTDEEAQRRINASAGLFTGETELQYDPEIGYYYEY